MIEFIQTLGKGIVQGFRQYIDNDLSSYVPLFIIAAVLIIAVKIRVGSRAAIRRRFHFSGYNGDNYHRGPWLPHRQKTGRCYQPGNHGD